jgi:precorrin-2 dehydrogenase/sirohydrochlorin ferrochelatase
MPEPRFIYPMMLRLAGRRALVVGGGQVALRKATSLADAGATVRAVSPEFVAEFRDDARLECREESYGPGHMAGVFVVIAATDDGAVNARVAADARAAGVLVNVVDRPELCDFIVPAVMERGRLVIAISTSGAAPSFARRLRDRLKREIGPDYRMYLDVMDDVRTEIMRSGLAPDRRRRLFERLTEDDVVAVAGQGEEALRRAVAALVEAAMRQA